MRPRCQDNQDEVVISCVPKLPVHMFRWVGSRAEVAHRRHRCRGLVTQGNDLQYPPALSSLVADLQSKAKPSGSSSGSKIGIVRLVRHLPPLHLPFDLFSTPRRPHPSMHIGSVGQDTDCPAFQLARPPGVGAISTLFRMQGGRSGRLIGISRRCHWPTTRSVGKRRLPRITVALDRHDGCGATGFTPHFYPPSSTKWPVGSCCRCT